MDEASGGAGLTVTAVFAVFVGVVLFVVVEAIRAVRP